MPQLKVYDGVDWVPTAMGAQGLLGLQGTLGLEGVYLIASTPPITPPTGKAWLDTVENRLAIFDGTSWFEPYGNLTGIQGLEGIQGFGYDQLQGTQGLFGLQGIQGITGIGAIGALGTNTGTTYTPVIGDANTIMTFNNAAAIAITIPTNDSVAYALHTQLTFVWDTGAGQPTISAVTPATTTIISIGAAEAAPKLRVKNSVATAMKLATDRWVIAGDIE